LSYAEILTRSHHEKWNGCGYPNGLKGEEIPLQGRLMALVDVFDALTNERPYKKAFSHEESVKIIREERGEHFDPQIVDVFLEHQKEFTPEKISDKKFTTDFKELESSLHMFTNMANTREAMVDDNTDRIRDYLRVFLNNLMENESYKKEISSWDKEVFLLLSQLHDIGKIAVADHILNKAGRLSDDEYESVRAHTDFGVKVVEQIKENIGSSKLLSHAETMAGSHHEKWDGTGYPHGLKGKDIPLQGRIMSLVDVYYALTTDRPHRKRKTHKEAIEIIINGRGTSFDPELVDVFLECAKGFEEGSAK